MARRRLIVDLAVEDHGSIALLRPRNRRVARWLRAHLAAEGWQWIGAALAVEPRYVGDILNAINGEA